MDQKGQTTAQEPPVVSVVIPCYNQAHFLGEAIESVLSQSYPHFEVVVVDDGSTDNTAAVAARYPKVRCIRQENQGLAGARNTGIRRTNGSYLVFLDADDRLLPEALNVGLEQLKEHPECAFVAGHHRLIAADGSLVWELPYHRVEQDHYAALLHHNYIAMHATVMYRREVFESAVGFDTSLRACEDYDLFLRIARNFPVQCHDALVAEYRRHDKNMTSNAALMLKTTLAVLRSQRKYVKRNQQYKRAYETGIMFWQKCYGEALVNEVRDHVEAHEWKRALRGMRVLQRYYPQGLESVLGREPMPRAELDAPPGRVGELAEGKEAAQRETAALRKTAEERTAQLEELAAKVQRLSSREDELQEELLDARHRLFYQRLIQRVREVVSGVLPAEARVLVVSRGDEELLNLDSRRGWHFPQNEDGVYAGHYPADSAEAIAHLEALREKGAEFLLFPAMAFWWLEHYGEFERHLRSRYLVVAHEEEDACLIFALHEPMVEHQHASQKAISSQGEAAVTTSEPGYLPPVGQVRFGNLRRVIPISREFGYDRGQPIDRYYIENFLASMADDIRGRVLEIGDDSYTRRFGGSGVAISDVLHVTEGNPQATIVADLRRAENIPSETFDCVILTQTLHLIYEVRAAIHTIHRILKPGGVLLATFPGISQISQDEWGDCWYWAFTTLSARRLFEEIFPAANIRVDAHGNVLTAISFLHGLAVEELRQKELDYHDPLYEVLITLRAVKVGATHDPILSEGQVLGAEENNLLLERQATRHNIESPIEQKGIPILLYHRVAELRSDPWALSVTPNHFAEHLEILRGHAHPMRLQQLPKALLERNLPDRSVIVTFDDGYIDNLHIAKPLLKRYDIPATFFLPTGYVGREREFWWDELDRLLLQPGTLPKTLHLSVNGSTYQWELGEAANYSEDDFQRNRHWRAWEDAPSSRHFLYNSLWELLRTLTKGERQTILDDLLAWAGTEPTVRPTHCSLSLEEVLALAQGELIEVGAHTVTHPALSALPALSQRDEILESKARLEEVLGSPVTSFAYPYGKQRDYTAETVSIIREAGFACACSNFTGVVGRSTDQFQLPRVHVQDWNGEEFAGRLSKWFDD